MNVSVDLRSVMGGKISGVENYVINVLNRLASSVSVSGFYNNYTEIFFPFFSDKIKIERTGIPNKIFNPSLTFFNFPKFESLYSLSKVVWMPNLRPFALRKTTKLAITVHDLSPVIHPEFFSWKMRIWHSLNRHKKAFKRADLIFAVSQYTKYDLINICGLDANKIHVVYPGIDHEAFNPNLDEPRKREVRNKYDIPENFILSISTIEPRKNILTLIRAFELIEDDVSLVIAGRLGWVYKEVLKAVNNSRKKDKIHLIGYVDEEDKPFLIGSSKVVSYPSFYEGFGFVPLEAMACGVPAISSARTSMPEVCGDAALLIEPYQETDMATALHSLLSDRALREQMIQKGFMRAKLFTWEKTAENIKFYLEELENADRN